MADKKDDAKLSPQAGIEQIQHLIGSVGEAAGNADLGAMDDVLAALGGIVRDTGVEIPGMAEKLDTLRDANKATQHHLENIDAALWVGDLARVHQLNETFPDTSQVVGLNFDGIEWDEDEDEDYDEEDDQDDEEFDLEDELFAGLAPIPAPPKDILPDLYADIVKGIPGAIDAFIASGEDPNTPRGGPQHTALLAALDAPNRRADQIGKLIAAGADPMVIHYQGDNALSWAAGYHHPETVTADSEIALWTLLASHGVDPNHWTDVQNWSVLHRAIIQGDGNRTAAALAAGADPGQSIPRIFLPEKLAGLTTLMVAAPKPDVVQCLLAHGADPRQPDAKGRAPLDFLRSEVAAARARATPDDPWTVAHAEALERSAILVQQALDGR